LRRKMQIRNEEDQGSGNDASVLKIQAQQTSARSMITSSFGTS
jgi:hypothetical protein